MIAARTAAPTVVVHSVVPARIYVDKDGNWAESKSLRTNDLLIAAKALDVAHSWICATELEARKQST